MVCTALFLLVSGCGPGEPPAKPHASPRPGIAAPGPNAVGTFVVEGSSDGSLSYRTPKHFAAGAGLSDAGEMVRRSERTILRFDRTADGQFLGKLTEAFTQSHGFWQEITLAERDPDAEYAEHEATITLDKASYSEHERHIRSTSPSRSRSACLARSTRPFSRPSTSGSRTAAGAR
jgi:hypothetical protein